MASGTVNGRLKVEPILLVRGALASRIMFAMSLWSDRRERARATGPTRLPDLVKAHSTNRTTQPARTAGSRRRRGGRVGPHSRLHVPSAGLRSLRAPDSGREALKMVAPTSTSPAPNSTSSSPASSPPPALSLRLIHIEHYRLPVAALSPSTPFVAARLAHVVSSSSADVASSAAGPPSSSLSPPSLPVLRLFGRTSDARSVCAHLHGLRPYLLLPLPQALRRDDVAAYLGALHRALDTALQRAAASAPGPGGATTANALDSTNNSNPAYNPPRIAAVTPELRTPAYGFYPPTLFARVATFHPSTPPAIPALLSTVPAHMPPRFASLPPPGPPHDAHIPFVLQFLTDHSLAPMDTIAFRTALLRTASAAGTDPAANTTTPSSASDPPKSSQPLPPGLQPWPFHVPCRATADLEVDVFADDLLPPPRPELPALCFVSRTLAGLWHEERLRSGQVPSRPPDAVAGVLRPPGVASVPPGAHLSDPLMRPLLAAAIEREHIHIAQCREKAANQQTDVERGTAALNDTEPSMGEAGPDDVDDFADVLDHIDGTPSLEVAAPLDAQATGSQLFAQPAEDSIDAYDILPVEPAVLPRPPPHTSEKGDNPFGKDGGVDQNDEEEDDSIQAWHDIASCTQHHAASAPDPTREPPVSPSPRKRSKSQVAERVPCTPPTPRLTPSATPTPTPRSAPRHLVLRPAKRPPRLPTFPSCVNDPVFAIEHVTPFASSPLPRGPVRKAGPAGLQAFPSLWGIVDEDARSEFRARIVTPVRKPPLASHLLPLSSQASGSTAGGERCHAALDNAGRLIRTTKGAAPTLSLASAVLPAPPTELVGARVLGESPASSSARLTVSPRTPLFRSASGRQVHAKTPLSGKRTPAALTAASPARPHSPKYDEQFLPSQLLSLGSGADDSCNEVQEPSDAAAAQGEQSESLMHERNETVTQSQTQSPHRFQNTVTMSIEVLAGSYGDRFPDPTQNGVLAVCAATYRDIVKSKQTLTDIVLHAVKPTPRLGAVINLVSHEEELQLFDAFASHVRTVDPDFIVGFETQNSSIGFLLERATVLAHPFANSASRWLKGAGPAHFGEGGRQQNAGEEGAAAKYYQRKGADVKLVGRHILNIWRIVRSEVKLSAYSREIISEEIFGVTFPAFTNRDLEDWYGGKEAEVAVQHLKRMTILNLALIDKLNVLSRTGELARVFGIEVMSVMNRGSQYRVESMLRRIVLARGYALLSAVRDEVFKQPAVEALPLVMEPESALYVDPVIVLDFQSLYPSVVIAHNLCYSTMLGNVRRIERWGETRRVGVYPHYTPPALDQLEFDPMEHVFVSSSGEMFVDATIRRGLLPQMLEEILETRVMVKKAMKSVGNNDEATTNLLNARQFGLKMIANVTYGYTSASFSGRMPCAGLADAIVQCGRDSLEAIIRYVDNELQKTTGARVVYGDTDSLFVLVPGASREQAFDVGETIVRKAAEMFPKPMALKLEKVYQPCILQTKKRYVGYAYESRGQAVPLFDAKGIETVRRDSCPLVQKALERGLRLLFETRDMDIVRNDLAQLVRRMQTGRVALRDYIFRREVRLGSYKEGHLPPAGVVATKAVGRDSRASPRYGERVPFVVVYDRPGAPLKDCVISPEEFLATRGARLNITYYITKQLLPALERSLGLAGARVTAWYSTMPRHVAAPVPPSDDQLQHQEQDQAPQQRQQQQRRLSTFYAVRMCAVCHARLPRAAAKCAVCTRSVVSTAAARFVLERRRAGAQLALSNGAAACAACAGWAGAARACRQLACETHSQRRDAERELAVAAQALRDADVDQD